MSRWEPGAMERLQAAAMTLFQERGYDAVTVAEIAARAGLTRRTFFNYFADKREIFFVGAADFLMSVARHLGEVEPAIGPLDAAAGALTAAGRDISHFRVYAPAISALVASSAELTERDLAKRAAVAEVVALGLQERGVAERSAALVASCAVTAYRAAWDDWGKTPDADFRELMRRAVAELRAAVAEDLGSASFVRDRG